MGQCNAEETSQFCLWAGNGPVIETSEGYAF